MIGTVLTCLIATSGGAESPAPTSKVILERIDRERGRLAAQKAEIDAAKADLATAEQKLDAKIKALEMLIEERKAVEKAILAARDVVHDVRIKRLVKIAEKMTPEDAAVYLNGLDDTVAASIVEGMKVRKAALVLSRLPASKSSKLSRLYLTRESPRDSKPDRSDGSEAAPE